MRQHFVDDADAVQALAADGVALAAGEGLGGRGRVGPVALSAQDAAQAAHQAGARAVPGLTRELSLNA